MLTINDFKKRSAYWSAMLELFQLRSIGVESVFCVMSQELSSSPVKKMFFSGISLSSDDIESHYSMDIFIIRKSNMDNAFKHFKSFLAGLNSKQLRKFILDNRFYVQVILSSIDSKSLVSLIRLADEDVNHYIGQYLTSRTTVVL